MARCNSCWGTCRSRKAGGLKGGLAKAKGRYLYFWGGRPRIDIQRGINGAVGRARRMLVFSVVGGHDQTESEKICERNVVRGWEWEKWGGDDGDGEDEEEG